MNKSIRLLLLSVVLTCVTSIVSASTIATSGAVAGEWTADWAAARKLAADTGTFYIINFGKTSGCAYCAAAELGIWSQVEFQQWAKSNGIPLVYANRVSDTSEPGVSVNNTYPGLKYYPTLLLIDGKGTGKTLIKEIITRYGITYNGITIDLTPSTFIAIVNSYTKNLTSNADAWDATATAPGDETSLLATPLAMATTNQLHGAHSLKGSDTNDWFAITNLVAGQRYRIAVTNLVTASTVAQMSFVLRRLVSDSRRSTTRFVVRCFKGDNEGHHAGLRRDADGYLPS